MKASFVKYSGNGNDFLIFKENQNLPLTKEYIQTICDRHFGVGADGVLILGRGKDVDGTMRVFNSDGGEAEMCGNGLRCLVTYLDSITTQKKEKYRIQTMNHIYEVGKRGTAFAIHMSDVKDKNVYDLSIFKEFQNSFFVNTGVPHLVFLTDDVRGLDIKSIAPFYRNHPIFPNGTNVSFVEVVASERQEAFARSFERGVEDETFSCGTGLTATALALNHWFGWKGDITLETKGGKHKVSVDKEFFYSGEEKFCFSGEVFIER